MRIATVNVNGVRATARKGMGEQLIASAPDILLLQEARAGEQIVANLLPGYGAAIQPCRIKGRAGVGVAVREGGPATFGELRYGMAAPGTEEPDVDPGRWLEADLNLTGFDGIERLAVISAYLHSGQLGTEEMDQKYAHLEFVDARIAELLAAARDGGPQVVVAEDLNVVRSERDTKSWKSNHNKITGVMDEEITHLEGWFASGWVDASRHLVGDEEQGPYTWWSQRGKAFDNNAGWRIDCQVLTPALIKRAHSVTVDRASNYTSRWSDHAPLVVEYRWRRG